MQRSLIGLSETQQSLIDLIHVQQKKFSEVAEMLKLTVPEVSKMDMELRPYWLPVSESRKKWLIKKTTGNFWDFHYWCRTAEEHCHYCGITKDQLGELHLAGINNKRPTPGQTLEIDRILPDESYDNIPNLTYSCYWCNNAKTDTFTEEEFKIIGQAIAEVWRKRLSKST